MRIGSSLYPALRCISTAIVKVMPDRRSTWHHNVRVVKGTQNVLGKKTIEWQYRMQVVGLKADVKNKERKVPERWYVVSGVTSSDIVMSASPSPRISAPAQADPVIDGHTSYCTGSDPIRSDQAESKGRAAAPLALNTEKSYIRKRTTPAENHIKQDKRETVTQSSITSKKAESVVIEDVSSILLPQARKGVPQRVALREPVPYIKRVCILPSLAPILEFPLSTPPQESSPEFARKSTGDAVAKTEQGIAALESGRDLTVPAQRPDTDVIDFHQYVNDENFIAVDAYMKDCNNRLMLDKNGEMVI